MRHTRLPGLPLRDQWSAHEARLGRAIAIKLTPHSVAAEVHIHMRLRDKVAIVVGAGQSPGEGMGNGRATVMRFVQEGAKVLAVDSNLASAEETVAMAQPAGECVAF